MISEARGEVAAALEQADESRLEKALKRMNAEIQPHAAVEKVTQFLQEAAEELRVMRLEQE